MLVKISHQSADDAVVPALCAGSGADRRTASAAHPRAWRCPHPATVGAPTSPSAQRQRPHTAPRAARWDARPPNLSPRSGEIFVTVGCAYSRHPRYRTQNQPHPGGVRQNVETIACSTPPGCNKIEQTIPWVLQTHGYKHCTTPWCENAVLTRMAPRAGSAAHPRAWRCPHPATVGAPTSPSALRQHPPSAPRAARGDARPPNAGQNAKQGQHAKLDGNTPNWRASVLASRAATLRHGASVFLAKHPQHAPLSQPCHAARSESAPYPSFAPPCHNTITPRPTRASLHSATTQHPPAPALRAGRTATERRGYKPATKLKTNI
jgi:hypothetical protein